MKTIGLQIAVGLMVVLGSAAANAEPVWTPVDKSVDAVAQDASSRHRHHHRRIVGIHTRYDVYSSYPRAPWYSRDYFPRYQAYPLRPISVVYVW